MNQIYELSDFFMVRVPMKAQEEYELINNPSFIDEIKRDAEFEEALYVATQDLSDALRKSGEVTKEIKLSLYKYWIRSISRTTPYGLFAAVSLGHFGDKTTMSFDKTVSYKRSRIDMGWLYAFIDKVKEDKEVLFNCFVRFNSRCYIKGDRLVNPYYTGGGNPRNKVDSNLSVRFTGSVELVKDFTAEKKALCDVLEMLCAKNPEVSEEKLSKFLETLLENEFLLLDLYPPLINTDPCAYLTDRLRSAKGGEKYAKILDVISDLLVFYDGQRMGEGKDAYLKIKSKMEQVCKKDDYVQVDSAVCMEEPELSDIVREDIRDVADLLLCIAPEDACPPALAEYKRDFIERYGYCEEVPVSELLDESIGLGAPAGYLNSRRVIQKPIADKKSDAVKNMILNRIMEALAQRKEVVSLNRNDIESVCAGFKDIKKEQLPDSFELYMMILSDSRAEIDLGNYRLIFTGCECALNAGNSFGRFADILPDMKKYEDHLAAKQRHIFGDNNVIIAEIYEQIRNGRTNNVTINYNSKAYQLALSANPCTQKKELNIEDIYIGIDSVSNELYARSKSFGKRVLFRTTNMLNPLIGSNVFRFLREIGTVGSKYNLNFSLALLKCFDLDYVPRIEYNKCILCPARWRIVKEKIYEKEGEKNKDAALEHFRQKWFLPRYINIVEGDNTLTIDLDSRVHREILILCLDKQKDMMITEALQTSDHTWLTDKEGLHYCCEMVFPLIQKKDEAADSGEICKESSLFFKDEKSYLFSGEDGWYYFKFYGISDRETEFIGEDLKDFCAELEQEGIVIMHFFIRYFDTGEHVRCRFKVNDKMRHSFLDKVFEWLLQERQKGMISEYAMIPYRRECGRYGGKALIEAAETCFYKDSVLVETLCALKYERELEIEDDYIGIANIVSIMDAFGMDHLEEEAWLTKNISLNSYRSFFHKKEKEYRSYIEKTDICAEHEQLLKTFADRSEALHAYMKTVRLIKERGDLKNTEYEILSSMIHMFCNRFKANNEWESKVRALTRHSLHSLNEYEKHSRKQKQEG